MDDGGVLEGQEHTGTGSLKDAHLVNVGPHVVDGPLGDFVGRVAHDDAGKGGFSGAVSPHDDMDFTSVDGQIHAVEDGRLLHANVEVFDTQDFLAHVHPCFPVSSLLYEGM